MRAKVSPWGDAVNDASLAYALLGLGLLPSRLHGKPDAALQALAATLKEDEGLAYRWRFDRMPSTPLAWSRLPDAQALGAVVRDCAAARPLRFALLPGSVLSTAEFQSFVASTLAPTEVATHILCQPSQRRVKLRWPLRIGFPPGPRAEDHVAAMLARDSWGGNVYEAFVLTRRRSESDLLVCIEQTSDAGAMLVSAARDVGTIRADLVVVFPDATAARDAVLPRLEQIRALADAGGGAHFGHATGDPVDVLREICIQMSHNLTLDVAIAFASQGHGLLMASTALLDASKLEFKAQELAVALTSGAEAGVGLDTAAMGPWAEAARGGRRATAARPAAAPRPAATRIDMGRLLRRSIPEFGWHAESAEASELGRVMRTLAEDDKKQSGARFLQAGFARPAAPDTLMRGVIKPSTACLVNVFIGKPRAGYARGHMAFPDLPPREDGRSHELEVVFWEPRLCKVPQVLKMELPPHGATLPVRFALKTRKTTKAIHARISVLHRNRVLQTGTLTAPVGRKGQTRFELDAIPRRILSGLEERTNFSMALVLNDTEGEGVVHAMADGKAQSFKVDDPAVTDLVTAIGSAISDIANDPDNYKGLDASGSQELLLELAARGADMRQYLERHVVRNGKLVTPEYVQVVATRPGKAFPLEYVYDWAAPDMDAKLCPNATAALAAGNCTATCQRRKNPAAMEKVVCPFGFWGIRCVIERKLHDNKKSAAAEPAGAKDTVLKPLTSILVGASARADAVAPRSVSAMLKRIRKLDPGCQQVKEWAKWPDAVARSKPATLALVVHQEVDARNSPSLEIGPPPLLKSLFLKGKHVVAPDGKVPPIVLLIGCETGLASISYESFAVKFQWHGAAQVVSTIATVLGRQAAPMAAEILEAIQAVRKPTSFAQVMRDLRRQLLASGTPMVLGLTSEGDADWEVVGNKEP